MDKEWMHRFAGNNRDDCLHAGRTLAVALKLMDEQQQAAVKERHIALAYVHQNSWLARPANHSAGRSLHTGRGRVA